MQKGILVAILLTLVVISLGAYTRLTDAGLGCPDWPGCYGQLLVPTSSDAVASAQQNFERPLEQHKAWNEMIHRYAAGTLGFVILGLCIAAWRYRQKRALATALLVLVIFQAALGMWTVTLGLLPLVVTAHLLAGFATLSLLVSWYFVRQRSFSGFSRMSPFLFLGLLILIGQIFLGGWTSTNYAAMSCHALPVCEQGWQESFDLSAFEPLPDTPRGDYEYGVLSHAQRTTIHASHRIGAAITTIYLLILALIHIQRRHSDFERGRAARMIWVLLLQVGLGLSNVVWQIPLPIAVAHNVVAALLLTSLISLIVAHHQRVQPALVKESDYEQVSKPAVAA
ncbi:heme A synthase [Alginatibacterium sediminis]|uniref:Heme A synthase n=1 Tax=Alginatibacterium sediminis TaxID=2164068 RepID=A0A420E5Z8_9ALTE|nr:COX15/CtaA family protein [Alginatibacterium sediminis]RKF13136.1 heme A synthase [Alginatibacterium sediminis]